MVEWSEVGERVRECRLTAGLSQEELASKVGLDRTMVAKIEIGSRRVDALELARLSEALGVPLDHFLRRQPAVLSRRAQPIDDVGGDVARRSQQLDSLLSAWVEDIRQLADLDVLHFAGHHSYPDPVDGDAAARQAALWLRDRLNIGSGPIVTVISACQAAGQLVLVTDLPGEGASLVDGEVAAAVVSRTADPGRRRATAAHELGHMVLGDEYSSDLGVAASREEREHIVDAFAAELLLPTEVIVTTWAEVGIDSREALVGLSARYRTSWSLAVNQAVHAGVLNRTQARELRSNTPTRAELMEAVGWAPQPDLESARVPPSYSHAVMEAWKQELITSARAVELMHGQITSDDLPSRDDSRLAP